MDPQSLIGPSSPLGLPAPLELLVFFKVLGFTLHMAPMNLWYVGPLLALGMRWRGGEHAGRLSGRLMRQMPVIVAYGVNFGIVPLLFTQAAYHKAFYPATILMAWPWFSVIVSLALAYSGVYLYAGGLKNDGARMTPLRRTAGWLSAVLFLWMGFLFAHGFSLMENVAAWPDLWQRTSVAGAPTGTALHTADPSLWPRWLMMIGLALTTTAAYVVADTGLFARRESDPYKAWARGFAFRLYTAGTVWFAATGAWYVFGTWRPEVRALMLGGPHAALTVLTALSPGLPWLLILAQRKGITPKMSLLTGLAQLLVLLLNAVSRQVVQNAKLEPFLRLTAEPVNAQWSPVILFLVLFAGGLAVAVWMIRKAAAASRQPVP